MLISYLFWLILYFMHTFHSSDTSIFSLVLCCLWLCYLLSSSSSSSSCLYYADQLLVVNLLSWFNAKQLLLFAYEATYLLFLFGYWFLHIEPIFYWFYLPIWHDSVIITIIFTVTCYFKLSLVCPYYFISSNVTYYVHVLLFCIFHCLKLIDCL